MREELGALEVAFVGPRSAIRAVLQGSAAAAASWVSRPLATLPRDLCRGRFRPGSDHQAPVAWMKPKALLDSSRWGTEIAVIDTRELRSVAEPGLVRSSRMLSSLTRCSQGHSSR